MNSDVRYPLQFNRYHKINDKYNPQVLPTAYFNILYLKNFRNPHYEFDVNISGNNKFKNYEINLGADNLNHLVITGATSYHKYDRNFELNNLFDIDISKSKEAQIYNIHDENMQKNVSDWSSYSMNYPNKNTTSSLIEYAKTQDTMFALTNSDYLGQFPDRMLSKTKDYLEPFTNYHINDNKVFNIRSIKWYKKLFQNSEIFQILINFGLYISIKLLLIKYFQKKYIKQIFNYNLLNII